MEIRALRIENFRNIAEARLEFPARVNLVLGDNGSGKTSLLEAVHLTLTGRSQRRAAHDVMLRRGSEYFRLVAEVAFGKTRATVEYAFTPGRTRTLKINNNAVRSTTELLQEFAVVSFAPEDLELVKGPPAARRAAFDFVLSTGSAEYLSALTQYQRAIQQKNRLLKDLQKTGGRGVGDPQLSGFNEQLVTQGVRLMTARQAYTLVSADDLRDVYSKLSDGAEAVATRYVPSVTATDQAQWTDAFAQALIENSEKERILGMSVVGPHRDDWELLLAGRAARQFASQGQARSLAVALKLAGFRYLENVRGDTPVLLFDEIFGELDPGRGGRLLELVGEFAQALITSVQPATREQVDAEASSFTMIDGGIVT